MRVKFSELVNSKTNSSSKRYVLLILTYFLMLISAVLFFPIEIKDNNFELLKIIIGAFTLIIISGFTANAVENVKSIKEMNKVSKPDEP